MPLNTDVGICNRAIDLCRGERITNLSTGTSEEAQVCRIHYDHLKYKLLSQRDWWFASTYAQIAKSANTPLPTEWDYQYPLPADFLALREIVDSDVIYSMGNDTADGKVIYINDTTLIIRYTRLILEGDFPAMFADALSGMLALELVMSLKDIRVKTQEVTQIAESWMADAEEWNADQIPEAVPRLYLNHHRYNPGSDLKRA